MAAHCRSGLEPESSSLKLDSRLRGNDSISCRFCGNDRGGGSILSGANSNPGVSIRIDSPFEYSPGEIGLQLDFEAQRACLDWVEGYFVELVFFDGEG